MLLGRVCKARQSPMLSKGSAVNEAGTWEEGCRSYLGRPAMNVSKPDKQGREARLDWQESAEAIVPDNREGLNVKQRAMLGISRDDVRKQNSSKRTPRKREW